MSKCIMHIALAVSSHRNAAWILVGVDHEKTVVLFRP